MMEKKDIFGGQGGFDEEFLYEWSLPELKFIRVKGEIFEWCLNNSMSDRKWACMGGQA
jgi:hypothetical protein